MAAAISLITIAKSIWHILSAFVQEEQKYTTQKYVTVAYWVFWTKRKKRQRNSRYRITWAFMLFSKSENSCKICHSSYSATGNTQMSYQIACFYCHRPWRWWLRNLYPDTVIGDLSWVPGFWLLSVPLLAI